MWQTSTTENLDCGYQVAQARAEAEECTRRAPWFAKGYLRLSTAAARLRDPLAAARACVAGLAALQEQMEKDKGKRKDERKDEHPKDEHPDSRAPSHPSHDDGGGGGSSSGAPSSNACAPPTSPHERLRADLQVLCARVRMGRCGRARLRVCECVCGYEYVCVCVISSERVKEERERVAASLGTRVPSPRVNLKKVCVKTFSRDSDSALSR